jgi:hypothetical protein
VIGNAAVFGGGGGGGVVPPPPLPPQEVNSKRAMLTMSMGAWRVDMIFLLTGIALLVIKSLGGICGKENANSAAHNFPSWISEEVTGLARLFVVVSGLSDTFSIQIEGLLRTQKRPFG